MSAGPSILVVANGVDRSEAAIFAGLQAAGLCLTVVHDPGIPAASEEVLRLAGISCRALHVSHRLDTAAIRILRTLLREHAVELVYAPINRTLAASLQATRGTRVPVVGYRGTTGHLSRWDPASWLTYFHPRVAHIVCVSDAVRRHLAERLRIPGERLSRIYKGHDPAWYGGLRADTPLPPAPEGTLTVGFAGRIRPVKGVRYLIEAVRALSAREAVRVLLIGALDDAVVRHQLRDQELAGRVIALGVRPDAAALIGQCDVLALPSIDREGLPRAALEAFCQGVPLIASRVGGLPEIVDDGMTGFLVPPRDPGALAAAIRRLHADAGLRRQMGQMARRCVEERFHIRDTVSAYCNLFRRIADTVSHS